MLAPADAREAKPMLASDTSEPELEDEDENESSDRSYNLPGLAWQGYIFALVPVLVCMFGTGRETWSKGLAAILVAAVLICFAPQRKLPMLALFGLISALLAPLLAFLPAQWLLSLPAWRTQLQGDWDIQFSNTLTPQAWVTLEAWLFFALCLTWLAWCLMRGFSSDQRRSVMHTLTLGGILLCVCSIFEGMKWIEVPWWPRNPREWGESFGPFANRNHISSLAAITAVFCAATAYDAHRRKSRLWMILVAGIIPPLTCIFMNTSKGGLILLFVGLTTWFGTSAMRKGFFQKMAVSASLVFVIATLLVMSGGGVAARLNSGTVEEFTAPGARAMLLVETLGMMMHAPWLGVGLGNFDAVFPLATTHHEPRSRFLHPESDLLWLLAEGGLLTLVPCALVLLWIFNATGPWFGKKNKDKASRHDRKLRNAAAIGFGLGVLHGIFDVPNHGLGYALFMALLAGVAIRPRRLRLPSGLIESITLRSAGLAILALGAVWIGISLGHPYLLGSSAAQALRLRANDLASSGSPAGALPLMDRAIQMSPMDFKLYYERARIRLALGQRKEEALLDFSRSRMLDPHYAAMCYTEGVFWLDFEPAFSVIGWRAYLQRYPKSAPGIYGYYRMMLNHANLHPQLREPLWHLATTVELKLDFLEGVRTREEFDRCLRDILSSQPNLDGLQTTQRERLFEIWYQHGDQAALIAALETNRKWRDDGWRILAEHYARNSEFEKACQTVVPYLPSVIRTAPGTSTDIPALERALLYNPDDARRGIDLFQAQKTQGDLDGALRTLERIATIPNAPPFVRQEIASIYIMKQDFRRAWEHLREAMQKR